MIVKLEEHLDYGWVLTDPDGNTHDFPYSTDALDDHMSIWIHPEGKLGRWVDTRRFESTKETA